MENKGILNKKIESNELLQISKIVTIKALKVNASKGLKLAFEILEGKKKEWLEDLTQEVATQILTDNMVITRDAFRIVGRLLIRQQRISERLVVLDNSEEEDNNNNNLMDKKAYIEYLQKNGEIEKKSSTFDVESLGLTNRQMEILNIYSKGHSMKETADILGISKSTVSNVIYRLQDKLNYLMVV